MATERTQRRIMLAEKRTMLAAAGTAAGAAVLVAGFVLAAVCGSPSASAFTDPADVASLAVSAGIMLFAAYLLPDPEYYDESDE